MNLRMAAARAVTVGLLAVSGTVASSAASASNGFFLPGYGSRSLGLGGGGTALPEDALTVVNNVAGLMVIDGDRVTGIILSDNNPLIVRSVDGLGRGYAIHTWLRENRADPAAARSMAAATVELAQRIIGIAPTPDTHIHLVGEGAT